MENWQAPELNCFYQYGSLADINRLVSPSTGLKDVCAM